MSPRLRGTRRVLHAGFAVLVSLIVMSLMLVGLGPIPALGAALEPGGGVWDSGAGGKPISSQTVQVAGMQDSVSVSFDASGVPSVTASSDADLYEAQGYLQASFRLTQMDLERRTALGQLSALEGESGVPSDTFELQVGLARTASATWAAMPRDGQAAQALLAFSRGVNARLAQLRQNGGWPSLFALTGVYPRDWTPQDSLAVETLMDQDLSFNINPLDYAALRGSLGAARTAAWFPVDPVSPQDPYDPGPYQNLGVSPLSLAGDTDAAVPAGTAAAMSGAASGAAAPAAPAGSSDAAAAAEAEAASTLADRIRALPAGQIQVYPDSNAWVANGPAVAGGGALLAGDPHLQTTLPSFWYEMALSSPDMDVTGAALVGLPGILLGRNAAISWSITDMENQATLYYTEQTSPAHPNQYYWDGAWRTMQQLHYTIAVRGGASVPLTVDLTVHGPVLNEAGQTTSVTWTGNFVSQSLQALLEVDKAQNFRQFHNALAGWQSPALNFAYADDRGDIGIVAVGYLPQVKSGEPWYPLSGTGGSDLSGTVPYAAEPLVYNPPGHVLVTANQRPVSADYPYYIGTSLDDFDYGYRAQRIYQYLKSTPDLTSSDFQSLQNDVTDVLAQAVVPKLTAVLQNASLTAQQRAALSELGSWNDQMTATSAGAAIWWTFWTDYLSEVFQPWWDADKVPVSDDPEALTVGTQLTTLDEDLEVWTLSDTDNAAFSPPGKAAGDAASAMRSAFGKAVSDLASTGGSDPAAWQYGQIHGRELSSLTGTPGLGYGPVPGGGSPWTVDAAGSGPDSAFGPSWRMIVDWTASGTGTSWALYPGGQSEDPASPWYETFVADWFAGQLLPLDLVAPRGVAPSGSILWTLRPGG